MATVDLTGGGSGSLSYTKAGKHYVLEKTVDFSATSRLQNDVLQLFAIPAKTQVNKVQYDVTTAEGGTLTFDIGDGSDVDGFIDGANGNAVGSGVNTLALTEGAPNTVTGYSNGKYYSAADTIDLLVLNDADAAVVAVRVSCVDLS
jgi:hypothetical protein